MRCPSRRALAISSPRRARRRTASHAQLALLYFVAALGAAQISRTLDLALVPHSRCSHGELTHSSPHPGAESEAHDSEAPATDVTLRGSHHGGDSHDHCGATAVEPAAMPASPAAPQLTVLVWHTELDSGGAETIGGIPLLALAPKLSPPIA